MAFIFNLILLDISVKVVQDRVKVHINTYYHFWSHYIWCFQCYLF